ncbi:MAG: FAD-dependent oxidoreductase, partial [Synechococcales cyanobacterium T60_A2020_003]|nr:FAD-dependent oxidoreductase [Synechococcales cyanobacterium T60_A2020_003]
MPSPEPSSTRSYDFIGFGDEVPGILTLVSAAREFQRRTGRKPRTLILFKGSSANGVGGHLVRGGLSYLDRSRVPSDIRRTYNLPTFGEPSALYQEFLQRSEVTQIALDPRKANRALRQMLESVGADILSGIAIDAVLKEGSAITGIKLTKGETYVGKQFVDSTVNAELAQAAGIRKLPGFGTLGLPQSELPVTLVFETEGLSIDRLRRIEYEYLRRFTNPNDAEAQGWLNIAAGGDPVLADYLRRDLSDRFGNLKTMWIGADYIDVRSKALSIAYHAYRHKKLSLIESGIVFDNGNIALFPDGRMSWNALLLY